MRREDITTNDKQFDREILSYQDQANFKKMLGEFYGNILEWATANKYINDSSIKMFNFREEIVSAGKNDEATLRYAEPVSVLGWKKEMNDKGWHWVNDNVIDYATKKQGWISPYDVVTKIQNLYEFKYPYKQPISQTEFNKLWKEVSDVFKR